MTLIRYPRKTVAHIYIAIIQQKHFLVLSVKSR